MKRPVMGPRTWLVLLALVAPLLLAVPAAAQLDQAPGPNSPAAKEDVPLFRPEPDRIVGRITLPDPRAAVLVQPEGRDWRAFRMVTFEIGAAVVILGMVALLALFYFWRGRIRIESGWAGRTIRRFGPIERFAHWLTAVSFVVLALSGLIVTFGRRLLIPLLGHQLFTPLAEASKYAHNFFSFPFVLGLLLILVMWIRDNLPERTDLAWLKRGGGFFRRGVHPEAGRFNAGQKLIFWAVVLGGAALAVSGYLLMVPFYATDIGGMQSIHMVHAVLAALMIAVIIGHIYIGTLGMEGAFDAMASGDVDENWAREHHIRWYEETHGRGEAARLPAE